MTGEALNEKFLAAVRLQRSRAAEQSADIRKTGHRHITDIRIVAAKRIVHAAFQRVGAPLLRRLQCKRRILHGIQVDPLFLQKVPERFKRDGKRKNVRRTVRLVFLGGAGPEENHLDLISVSLFQKFRMRHHGRYDRDDGVGIFRRIFPDIIHGRRTGA